MSYADGKKAVRIGKNVTIEVDKFSIGDGVLIKDNVVIEGPEVSIGDYTVIGKGVEISGKSTCKIGMSSWLGQGSLIDASGVVEIGNGVGIANACQLWTHMRFGDTLQGCRFDWRKSARIDDDVYIGGNVLIGPIHAAKKSAALLGSVVTKDLAENRVYAGVPAIDVTERTGPHFEEVPTEEKLRRMLSELAKFRERDREGDAIQIVRDWPATMYPDVSYFNVATRQYTKRLTDVEIRFMLFLLTPIKFYPLVVAP
jgi:acetyltransferase-like isoleucine patch superfamily enzyme